MAKILIKSGINAQGVPFNIWKITKCDNEWEDVSKDNKDVVENKKKKDVGED